MWRAAPSAVETGQNSTVTGPQALTRYEYQSVVPLFPSCSMGERPTARETKTENRVEIFLCGNAKGENEFWTSGRHLVRKSSTDKMGVIGSNLLGLVGALTSASRVGCDLKAI